MKKLLVVLVAIVIGTAFAETINIKWEANDTTYATSTCESGGDLIIPQTPPTKYGHTFVGWDYGVITGTWSQSGTPTPTNPIEPVFYQLGDTVLRALGSGENFVADEYNPSSEKITRRVGVTVLKGIENWSYDVSYNGYSTPLSGVLGNDKGGICNVCPVILQNSNINVSVRIAYNNIRLQAFKTLFATVDDLKQWLAQQYANGTPVTVYYPLKTPVEESWSLSE